jgi:hypothetical protein
LPPAVALTCIDCPPRATSSPPGESRPSGPSDGPSDDDGAVGLKDRIAKGAARAGELVRDTAPAQAVTEGLASLKALLTDEDEREFVVERALVAMVRGVRDDDEEPLTDRDVEQAARRRFKRARRAALLAGPAVGTANQVVDLYCETATVCDLDRLHELGLSDERVAAQMLVLWNVTPDIEAAEAAILETGPSVWAMLTQRFGEQAAAQMPEKRTKTAIVKAMWNARGLANDARERVLGERNITGVMFAGKRVKEFVERAEAALGVAGPA